MGSDAGCRLMGLYPPFYFTRPTLFSDAVLVWLTRVGSGLTIGCLEKIAMFYPIRQTALVTGNLRGLCVEKAHAQEG